ncbi:AraC family transcriptional regulator [Salinicola rhizosphaerae]|uniref:AraC family transcriptional regulator n=1 Tax=Salinicola rhizosphaerae TaxID=1443141 RepID=A0ABQ3DLI1_9GAMM|nr:helix-turn-helix transcriptional regulator [Salinicola rhizosphaerae]GHB06862.1 AraC family transcriptional regulator [Salinicola rhizosphaerae]
MPIIPQHLADSSQGPIVLSSCIEKGPPRYTTPYIHSRGQLLGTNTGMLSVDVGHHQWVVLPSLAVWIPSGEPYALSSSQSYQGWAAYVAENACQDLPARPCIVSVSGLLREAVKKSFDWSKVELAGPQQRLAGVILDEIMAVPRLNVGLPMPRSKKTLAVARALSLTPQDRRQIEYWARHVGVTSEALADAFISETGLTFSAWRRRLKMLVALESILAGRSLIAVARKAGYKDLHGFITVFRKEMGVTPSQYTLGTPASKTP